MSECFCKQADELMSSLLRQLGSPRQLLKLGGLPSGRDTVQRISILGIAASPVPSPTLYLAEELGVPPFLHCFPLGT